MKPVAVERIEQHYDRWLRHLFPRYTAHTFASHHDRFWRWIWDIRPGERPPPYVAIWPRGGAKSTSAELATVALGALGKRRYVLYVSATQDQADKHVDTVAAMLESSAIETYYPNLGSRLTGKYGQSRGWRRSRIRTASGFTVDAIGLDTAARGIKVEEDRPDAIIIDDIDLESDTPETTEKKIRRITHAILPAGSDDVAVLAIQNLVLPDGVFARLARVSSEPADFLADRIVSGPVPAVEGLETEQDEAGRTIITDGVPTWAGQDIDACQRMIDSYGVTAFEVECQHNVRERGAKAFSPLWWDNRARYSVHDEMLLRKVEYRIISFDTAEETGSGHAYTAFVVFDVLPWMGSYAALVREVWRDRVDSGELLPAVEFHAARWNHDQKLRTVVIENASSGKMLIKLLRINAPTWLRHITTGYPPRDAKDARAYAAAIPCRAGRVWLPEPDPDVPWLSTFTHELYDIPQSTYRDQSDAFSQGVIYLRNRLRNPGEARSDDNRAAA